MSKKGSYTQYFIIGTVIMEENDGTTQHYCKLYELSLLCSTVTLKNLLINAKLIFYWAMKLSFISVVVLCGECSLACVVVFQVTSMIHL